MTKSTFLATLALFVVAAACRAQQPSPLAYAPPVQPPPPPGPVAEFAPGAASAPSVARMYVGVDLAYLKPTLTFGLASPVRMGSFMQTVRPPSVDLDWTVSPAFEFGYRLAGGDAIAFGYRFLATEGTGVIANEGGPAVDPIAGGAQVRTRLDVQVFDLDYVFPLWRVEAVPSLKVTARVGGRIADVFFDSRVSNGLNVEQASNNYFGAGIHGRLDFVQAIGLLPGLSIFGTLDGSVLIGRSRQKYQLQTDLAPADVVEIDKMTQRGNKTVPTIKAQAGLIYAPPALPGLSFTSGYEYEQFFEVGNLGAASGEFYSHGWFTRVRYDF